MRERAKKPRSQELYSSINSYFSDAKHQQEADKLREAVEHIRENCSKQPYPRRNLFNSNLALETQFEEILEESNEVDETDDVKRNEELPKVVKQSHFKISKQA